MSTNTSESVSINGSSSTFRTNFGEFSQSSDVQSPQESGESMVNLARKAHLSTRSDSVYQGTPDVGQLTRTVTSLSTRMEELTASNIERDRRNDWFVEKFGSVVNKLAQRERENAALNERTALLEEGNGLLKEENAHLKEENAHLKEGNGRLEAKVQSLNASNIELASQHEVVLGQYNETQAASAPLRDRVQVLETQLQEAERRLAAAPPDYRALVKLALGKESDWSPQDKFKWSDPKDIPQRQPSNPPTCYTMNSFEIKDQWVVASGETVKAQEGEVFVNFGMGVLWRMNKGDVEKMKGWATGNSLKISYRNTWYPSCCTNFHYFITNEKTQQKFMAGHVATWKDQLPKITAVDLNRMTVYLSDGNAYRALSFYTYSNPFANAMMFGMQNLQVGQPFFVIEDERKIDWTGKFNLNYVEDPRNPVKRAAILSGVGAENSNSSYESACAVTYPPEDFSVEPSY